MASIFSQVLNMSMTGSIVIVLVMLVRSLLKSAPKIFSYGLWSVVLFRLLCPVALTAPVSVLDVVEPEIREASGNTSVVSYLPASPELTTDFVSIPMETLPVPQEASGESAGFTEQLRRTPMHAASQVWLAGMVGMLLYSVVQYLRLRRKLIGAMRLKRNIYLADHIDTAFVVGLRKPRIYLPSCVPAKERYYIIAHEQHHIRRFDHVIKLLAYLALCIHWFNPLVWLAFGLSGKDMEMSCDEAVIKRLGMKIRADYSASLLRLATHKKHNIGLPLAFGEGDTKGRVLNMAKWKKPTKLLVSICVILCIGVVVVCAFNPEEEKTIEELTRQTSEGRVSTGIGDLCFTYPGGLTSEQRDVDNWSNEDRTRSRRNLPTRRPYNHFFIDNGVDFGGVVDFIVPENREIRLEEMNLPTQWVGLDYISGSSSYPYAEMEYTLIKDGKDYIQIYLYTYSGRGYFLWFYTEQGNPAHKEAILESVELGSFSTTVTKLKRDEIVSLGQFNMTILKGYGYHRNEDKILEITRKERFGEQVVVGCVTARPNPDLPMETDSDWVRWVEAAGVDLHLEDPNYGYTITDQGQFGDLSFTMEAMEGKKMVMSERHYFYIAGDTVYHIWFDAMQMNWADDKQMLESIWLKDPYNLPAEKTVAGDGTGKDDSAEQKLKITINSTADIGFGDLYFHLPEEFTAETVEADTGDYAYVLQISNGTNVVGGAVYHHVAGAQTMDFGNLRGWLPELGLWEASDETLGYFGGGSIYAHYELEYFKDLPAPVENPVSRKHYFYLYEDAIYDLWFDTAVLDPFTVKTIMQTAAVGLNGPLIAETPPDKEETLERCRTVLEEIQNGSSHIAWHRSRISLDGTTGYAIAYFADGEDWLHITYLNAGSSDMETQYRMKVDGKTLSYMDSPVKENGSWGEGNASDPETPWLTYYQWDDTEITLLDLHQSEEQMVVMLKINEPFSGFPAESRNYYVNFFFDGNGNFVQVQLQSDVMRNGEPWTAQETEELISLNTDAIHAEIQKAYQQAING